MAKINRTAAGGRRTHQVGLTLFTERTRPATFTVDGVQLDCARVYREAFRLRSDGMVQTRILETRPASICPDCGSTNLSEPDTGDGMVDCYDCGAAWVLGHTTKHSSGYRNLGRLRGEPAAADLRTYLARKGYTITKEA